MATTENSTPPAGGASGAAAGAGIPLPASRIIPQRALRVLGALLFASACCLGMIGARRFLLGRWTDLFMIWNLALAWVPLPFSAAVYRMHTTRTRRNLLFFVCVVTWFFFFPNAPYITTDFVHLRQINNETYMLFTILPIASFAWVGLCLGFCSLYLMQEVVGQRYGRIVSWLFVLAMLAAASLGTYVGRFLRWNTWDVLHHPWLVLDDLLQHRPLPTREYKLYLGMMGLFLLLSYSSLYALMHLHEKTPERASR